VLRHRLPASRLGDVSDGDLSFLHTEFLSSALRTETARSRGSWRSYQQL
jgi:hypothetical protein